MRVLVTGGTGYTGRAVADVLHDAGHHVTALTRQPGPPDSPLADGIEIAHVDLMDADTLRDLVVSSRFDGVCHLAARTRVRDSFEDPLGYFETNVGGTMNLLRALNAASAAGSPPARVVFASTSAVYGIPDQVHITEEHPLRPASPYGASKLAAEQLLDYHARTGAIGVVTLRAFNIAGFHKGYGDPDLTRVIPKALAVAEGRFPYFELNGDGSARRDFLHVTDMAEAYRLSLEAAQPGETRVYNVGSGQAASMREVVDAVERATGRTVRIRQQPPKNEPQELLAGTRRLRTELGWEPAHTELNDVLS